MSATKLCRKCQRRRTVDCFGPNERAKDGLKSECKDCFREYMKAWRDANPDRQKRIEKRQKAKLKARGLTGHENRDPDSVARYREKQNSRYRNDPEYRERVKLGNAARYHGITPEEYIERRSKPCEICGEYREPKKAGNGMHIDHDHETGKLRGTLCELCNRGLGSFKDSRALLKKAMGYLAKYA